MSWPSYRLEKFWLASNKSVKATYSPFDLVCLEPLGTAATAVPALGLWMLFRLDLLVLEADRWNEAAAAPALFLTSLGLVVETLPGWFPSPRRQSSFGMFANCVWAFLEWNHSATWRNCPAPDHVCLLNRVQGDLQIPSSLSRARRNYLTSRLGYLLILGSGSLHAFPNDRWRCQRRMKKFPRFFSCVARATVIAVIGTFVGFIVCWGRESAEHCTSFRLTEWLLTLLVERSEEGVSLIFPSLQSRQVFILPLARLPKLASPCNLVVISPAALESPVDLVRPGFVIWNIKTRISVRT